MHTCPEGVFFVVFEVFRDAECGKFPCLNFMKIILVCHYDMLEDAPTFLQERYRGEYSAVVSTGQSIGVKVELEFLAQGRVSFDAHYKTIEGGLSLNLGDLNSRHPSNALCGGYSPHSCVSWL